MTRDDIIRMAREAGLERNGYWEFDMNRLERFVTLVTAAKDAEHQQTLALQQRSYEREIQLAVEAEREACAKLCDSVGDAEGHVYDAADYIRARGTK